MYPYNFRYLTDIHVSVYRWYDFNFDYNQQDATNLMYLFVNRTTCFGRFLRPSSGAHNCIHSYSSAAGWYRGSDGTDLIYRV